MSFLAFFLQPLGDFSTRDELSIHDCSLVSQAPLCISPSHAPASNHLPSRQHAASAGLGSRLSQQVAQGEEISHQTPTHTCTAHPSSTNQQTPGFPPEQRTELATPGFSPQPQQGSRLSSFFCSLMSPTRGTSETLHLCQAKEGQSWLH